MDDNDYDIATLYNNIGNCFARSGEYIKAIHAYKKSLKNYPNNSAAYNNLGNCYVELGKYKEAQQLYERSIQINCNKSALNKKFKLEELLYNKNFDPKVGTLTTDIESTHHNELKTIKMTGASSNTQFDQDIS